MYNDDYMEDERHRGIFRQITEQGLDSLTKKQSYVYHNEMVPSCVEKCSFPGCINPTVPGNQYCNMHDIEYG